MTWLDVLNDFFKLKPDSKVESVDSFRQDLNWQKERLQKLEERVELIELHQNS